MNWNDLIARLNEIPEDKREETAIFSDGDGQDFEIDDLEIKPWSAYADDTEGVYTDPKVAIDGINFFILTP